MSSETNRFSLEMNLRKHPLESDASASSDVFMENKRQKVVHVIRDFPEGCGPSILSEKDEEDEDEDDDLLPVEEPFEGAEKSQSPVENFSDTELDSFLTEEEDYNDSGMQYFWNSMESPVEEGQSDFVELDCDENCLTDEELEDFGQPNLQYVDNSEHVDDNFAQSESSGLIRTDLLDEDLEEEEEEEEEELEEKRVNHYPPWPISAFRDFPSGCGPEPSMLRHSKRKA